MCPSPTAHRVEGGASLDRTDGSSLSVDALIDIGGACARLGISRSTLFNLLRDGKLVARKLGRRTLIRASDIDAFVLRLERASYRAPVA